MVGAAVDSGDGSRHHRGMIRLAPARRTPRSGFTLIELMIAVVVVGILLAVAFPSFMDSIRKNRRSDAFSALNAAQQAQERWRAGNPAYATALTSLGWAAAEPASPGGYYTFGVVASSATGYTITASPVAGKSQASDGDCAYLRVRAAAGEIFYGSSSSAGGTFVESVSNRCWSR